MSLAPHEAAALFGAIRRISLLLTRPFEAERALRLAAEEAAVFLGADGATICTLEPEGDVLRMRAGVGVLAGQEGRLLPLEGSVPGIAISTRAALRREEANAGSPSFLPLVRDSEVGPVLASPLLLPDRVLGAVVAARRQDGAPFEERAALLFRPLAELIGIVVENVRLAGRAREGRTEIDAWRHQRELAAWRGRYDAAARWNGLALFEWNPATDRLCWSETVEPLLGVAPEEAGLTLGTWIERVHPEDRERFLADLAYASRENVPLRVEHRVRHSSGGFRSFLFGMGRTEAEDGVRVVGLMERTTAPVGGTRTLPMEGAKEIIQALRHEINNPLAVVMGQAQLLQKEDSVNDDPVLQQSVSAIYAETQRMQDSLKRLAELESSARDLLSQLGVSEAESATAAASETEPATAAE